MSAAGEMPRVSVVTPSYNQAAYLEETILSVLTQDYPNIEYIVIDGGSTDGSVDIIKRYAPRLAYWVSERDRGQSHAINKGWRRATGDILAYLNSDDLYTPGAVAAAVAALIAHRQACMICSDELLIDEQGTVLRTVKGRPFDIREVIATENRVGQPTVFIWRWALDAVGLLDERLHMAMDHDLWIRLGLRYPVVYLPDMCLAKARWHAAAKSTAQFAKLPPERRRILNKVYARADLPPEIREVRAQAYAAVSYYQAALAAYLGQPRHILSPLVRAAIASPTYVTRRPLPTLGLLVRLLLPWWQGRPSPLVVKLWHALRLGT